MTRPRTVLVPTDLPLVYDAGGWRFGEAPPDWWLELTEPEIADVETPLTWQGFPAPLADKRTGGRGKKATETGTNLEPVSHARKTKNVAAQGTGYSNCRPGRGPCRRRHEHASRRRAA